MAIAPTNIPPERTPQTLTVPAGAGAGAPTVPNGFVGVDANAPMFDPSANIDVDSQLKTMVASGVQSIRVAFSWAAAQPYASAADVPAAQAADFTDVGGLPTDFQATDEVVGDAARRHISVLPTVMYAPSWDAVDNAQGIDTPRQDAPYGAYLTALVDRYGPHGTFWSENPRVPRMPIGNWQIWNEPNLSYYWPQPFATSYVALLRTANHAIKAADPSAHVVLGALTNLAWRSIGQIYRVPGARKLFDVVAVNGFTKLPDDVILYLRLMRDAMDRFGDGRKPLVATEVSWPSAVGSTITHFDFDTTPAGQAQNIATLLPLLGRDWESLRLGGFYWYTWLGDETRGGPDFNFAGLERYLGGRITAKPALAAFRRGVLALEGCRRKGPVATACIH